MSKPAGDYVELCTKVAGAAAWWLRGAGRRRGLADSPPVSEPPSGEPVDGGSPIWRITERSVEVAQSRAGMWLTFAGRSLQRAREGGVMLWGLVTESWAFVIAIDHLRNCAVMAKAAATVDGVADSIAVALATFDEAVPDVADLRNVLEHHDDEYVLGTGDLQQPQRPRRARAVDEALASEWGIQCGYADPFDAEHPWIAVGPSSNPATGSHHLRVDLAETYEAARILWVAVYNAAIAQGLQATNQHRTPTTGTD